MIWDCLFGNLLVGNCGGTNGKKLVEGKLLGIW